jgi:4-amino-4-deoxy-L-arabinose transferase-like glycosyltransferase
LSGSSYKQPFWYFAGALPLHLMPWAALLPGALLLAWRRRSSPSDRFLLAWVVFIVVFFSITTEKRALYVLPTFPAWALLFARLVGAVSGQDENRGQSGGQAEIGRRWVTVGTGLFAVLATLLGIAAPIVAAKRDDVPVWAAAVVGALFVITGLGALVASLRGRALGAVVATAGGIALCYLAVVTLIYPPLDAIKSARGFSLRIKEATAESRAAGHVVPSYSLSNLPEAFAFYTDGVYFPETDEPDVLAAHFENPDPVWAVADRDALHLLPADVNARLVVVHETRLSRKNVVLVRHDP